MATYRISHIMRSSGNRRDVVYLKANGSVVLNCPAEAATFTVRDEAEKVRQELKTPAEWEIVSTPDRQVQRPGEVSHTIWFAQTPTSGPLKNVVTTYSDAMTNLIAGKLWDTLQASGFHMLNTRP